MVLEPEAVIMALELAQAQASQADMELMEPMESMVQVREGA